MENKLKNYVLYLSIITIILMVIFYFVKDKVGYESAYTIPVMFLITLVSHIFLMRAMGKDPRKFYINFISATAIKMLASLAFLTIMFLVVKGITIYFALVFMGVYLVYTLFEMLYLRPMSKKK